MKKSIKKFFMGMLLVGIPFFSIANPVDRNLASILTVAAAEVNKQAPMQLDAETRMDNAATYSNVFIYTNTMINFTVDQFTREKFDQIIKQEVIDKLCANPQLDRFSELGVILVYRYLDKNGRYISELSKDMGTCP